MSGVIFRSDVTVDLIDAMGTEADIVHAARLSTKGAQAPTDDEAAGFVRWLLREGHMTPFEHCYLSFYLEVPVFVSRQIVKHRISSINEESGRYKQLAPVFYVPGHIRPVRQVGKTGDYVFEQDASLTSGVRAVLAESSASVWGAYETLLKNGVAKEVARMVLPVNIYSSMRVTMNLRSWLHFCALRHTESPSHGQYEIALVADAVGRHLEVMFPNVWAAFAERGHTGI